MRSVVLCDETGAPRGVSEIMAAHEGDGKLHRAFSVFVFRNDRHELLIQKRSEEKPLFAGRWANTCCSHPGPDEDTAAAGERRLQEEMGFRCPLREGTSFIYQARDQQSGLSENEYDTVLIGELDEDVSVDPDPAEVADWSWTSIDDIRADAAKQPEKYAPWFLTALAIALDS